MLEFGVLWAVLPVVDQLLRGHFERRVLSWSLVAVVLGVSIGLSLLKEEDE